MINKQKYEGHYEQYNNSEYNNELRVYNYSVNEGTVGVLYVRER